MENPSTTRKRRCIREMTTHNGRCRDRNRGRGHPGRGRGEWVQKTRSDSSIIILSNGNKIEHYSSFSFPFHIFQKIEQGDKDRLKRERAEYKRRKASEISSIQTPLITQVQTDQHTQVSQSTQGVTRNDDQKTQQVGSTIMGGRNKRVINCNWSRVSVLWAVFRTSQVKSIVVESSPNTNEINKYNMDADICCLGKNFVVYKYTRRIVDVDVYDKS